MDEATRPTPNQSHGHYHKLTATAKWAAFRQAMRDGASGTVTQRDGQNADQQVRQVHDEIT